jgi:hypothetical protein
MSTFLGALRRPASRPAKAGVRDVPLAKAGAPAAPATTARVRAAPLAKAAVLAAPALVTVLIAACQVGRAPSAPTSRYALFVEPDAWWSVEVPSTWNAYRQELDGSLTSVPFGPRRTPLGTPTPVWDPLSTQVVYIFTPENASAGCPFPCPRNASPSLTIVARELLEGAEGSPIAPKSEETPDKDRVEFPCPGQASCTVRRISAGAVETLAISVPVPQQGRLYQIKVQAGTERWQSDRTTLEHIVASFRPLRNVDF